jgi:prepilin-type N-terminal cleavage/methylation domain-containing protein
MAIAKISDKIVPNSRQGFTLIEILVTIFLVSVGLVGAMSFFSVNIASQNETKNELIAAGLAQEENEIIRNIVDYNELNGNDWYDNICNANNCPAQCKAVDITDLSDHTGHDCSSHTDIIKNGASQYIQGNDSNAVFSRSVDVSLDNSVSSIGSNLDDGRCIEVVSTVTWSGSDKQTQAIDTICQPR